MPERGYDLRPIPPAPPLRKIGADLARTPARLARADCSGARKVLADVEADVVVDSADTSRCRLHRRHAAICAVAYGCRW